MIAEAEQLRRSLAFYLVCTGVLMVVLDTTIVTVALPFMGTDLSISGTTLSWILNAYMLTYGGLLIVSGRLGDVYGTRRLFVSGVILFTVASLACGLSSSQTVLLVGRAAQGLAGAVVIAVALPLITALFPNPAERARAMGLYGFVCATGGAVGEILGGVLTTSLNWRWIFLINLPLGILVSALSRSMLPRDRAAPRPRQIDFRGAAALTCGLAFAISALINIDGAPQILSSPERRFAIGMGLLALFAGLERRAREPLMPARLFRLRNYATANLLGVLWSAASFAWFVMGALYLQRVLDYNPLQVGLTFLLATLVMAGFSAGLSGNLVIRFGLRRPLWIGLVLFGVGLALFAREPLRANFLVDIVPPMLLLGLGGGIVPTPLLLTAMSQVDAKDAGLASGVINTSMMMGGAIGLALLASLATFQTSRLQRSGLDTIAALNGGYRSALLFAALLIAIAAVIGAVLLRDSQLEEPASTIGATLRDHLEG